MSEVDGHLQTVAQFFMSGKLLAVIDRQCLAQPWRDDAERSFFGGVQSGAGAVFHLRRDHKAALTPLLRSTHVMIMPECSAP